VIQTVYPGKRIISWPSGKVDRIEQSRWRWVTRKTVATLSTAVALLGALTLLASLAYAQDASGGNATGRAGGKRPPASAATDNSGRAGMGED